MREMRVARRAMGTVVIAEARRWMADNGVEEVGRAKESV
jgi:hypothetical protein